MSTRSVIARPTPEGSGRGRYCHYDGDPAHQGRVLFDAVTGHFDGDPEAACRSLIDQHPPAGRCWVATSPSHLATGPATTRRSCATQCDCHGGRHEPPRPPLTDHTARAAFMDYAYVLEVDRLRVLTHRPGRLAAGRRAGLDQAARLGRYRPARPTPPPRVVAPPTSSIAGGRQGYGNGPAATGNRTR